MSPKVNTTPGSQKDGGAAQRGCPRRSGPPWVVTTAAEDGEGPLVTRRGCWGPRDRKYQESGQPGGHGRAHSRGLGHFEGPPLERRGSETRPHGGLLKSIQPQMRPHSFTCGISPHTPCSPSSPPPAACAPPPGEASDSNPTGLRGAEEGGGLCRLPRPPLMPKEARRAGDWGPGADCPGEGNTERRAPRRSWEVT